ncbi:MAG: hypothetical protein ABH850_03050 [Candidatus Micrarchaeota archaeon]
MDSEKTTREDWIRITISVGFVAIILSSWNDFLLPAVRLNPILIIAVWASGVSAVFLGIYLYLIAVLYSDKERTSSTSLKIREFSNFAYHYGTKFTFGIFLFFSAVVLIFMAYSFFGILKFSLGVIVILILTFFVKRKGILNYLNVRTNKLEMQNMDNNIQNLENNFNENLTKGLVEKEDYRLYLSVKSNIIVSGLFSATSMVIAAIIGFGTFYMMIISVVGNSLVIAVPFGVFILGAIVYLWIKAKESIGDIRLVYEDFKKYFEWKSNNKNLNNKNRK